MIRLCKIPGLHYLVDLCFVAHKLVIEIDEDDHPYYENDEIRQQLTENLGFTFTRINPDPDSAETQQKNNFKKKFAKKLLSYMSSFSGLSNTSLKRYYQHYK